MSGAILKTFKSVLEGLKKKAESNSWLARTIATRAARVTVHSPSERMPAMLNWQSGCFVSR